VSNEAKMAALDRWLRAESRVDELARALEEARRELDAALGEMRREGRRGER